MTHGPWGEADVNHTPFSQANQLWSFTRMTGVAVLEAYINGSEVPAMATSWGASPSYRGSGFNCAVARSILVVVGMQVAMTASAACCVPGTDAFTFSCTLSLGIFANSAGSDLPGTNAHGPARSDDRNQRPERRM